MSNDDDPFSFCVNVYGGKCVLVICGIIKKNVVVLLDFMKWSINETNMLSNLIEYAMCMNRGLNASRDGC